MSTTYLADALISIVGYAVIYGVVRYGLFRFDKSQYAARRHRVGASHRSTTYGHVSLVVAISTVTLAFLCAGTSLPAIVISYADAVAIAAIALCALMLVSRFMAWADKTVHAFRHH